MAADHLAARLLGGFELQVRGRPVAPSAFERPSGLRLLKLLLATPGHRLRREAAAELLWPDADPERSSANLRKAIHFARRALASSTTEPDGPALGDGDAVTLDHVDLDVDLDRLQGSIAAVLRPDAHDSGQAIVEPLDTLIRLGGEALLPGDPYEEWLVPIRERLNRDGLDALLAGVSIARSADDRARAFRLVERALALEPADERAHRLAIELHLDAGELHAARRQLQAARHAAAEAYGVDVDPALEDLISAAAAERAPVAPIPTDAPIVGRRRELSEAEAALDAAGDGRSSGVVLRGPAGIGKSRILRELVGSARSSGSTVLELRGLEGDAPAPFAALAAAITGALGDAVDSLVEPARSAVLTTSPSSTREDVVPAVEFASEAALARAVLQALLSVPPEGALTLVVDDVQWLDASSISAITLALRTSSQDPFRPVLLLATLRTDGTPSTVVTDLLEAVDGLGGAVVTVGPLGPREIRSIVERELGDQHLADDLAAVIAEQSAGAPLFAMELFRSARDSSLVESRDGSWMLRRDTRSLPVPPGITRLVERRVARLDAGAQRVLATAAELGDVVAFEDLIGTGARPDTVLDAVDAAIGLGVIAAIGGTYAFAHPLYRAALRSSLPPSARADIHERVMATICGGVDPLDQDAIRRAGAGTIDLVAAADHARQAVELGRADLAPVAVALGLAAGSRQVRLFDRTAAVATLQHALQLWHRLAPGLRAALPASDGYIHLARALRRAGDDGAALDAFRSAVATARDDDERSAAYTAQAWLPYEHGRFDEAIAIAREGLAAVSAELAAASLETMLGWVICRSGRWDDGRPILQHAVDTLERGGPSPSLMRALDRLGVALSGPEPMTAVALFERARWLAIEMAQTVEQATIEMHLGGQLGELGRFEEALAALERGRALCAVTGEQYIGSVIEWNAAQVAQQMGRLEEAVDHRRRELAIFAEIGPNPRHQALAHAHIAHLSRLLADPETAAAEAGLARASARSGGDPDLVAHVEWALVTDDWFAEPPKDGNTAGTA